MEAGDYSKEEILELIEQTKERYHIKDMSALGAILGDFHHNWYYYYKNHSKKSHGFLDALLAVQDPQEMFEKLRAATNCILRKKNVEKGDIKQLVSYVDSIICCVEFEAERFRAIMQEGSNWLKAEQDPNKKYAYSMEILDSLWLSAARAMNNALYAVTLACYLLDQRMKKAQGGMIHSKGQTKKYFDVKACYEAHCNTPEFELGRQKNLSREEEKETCWYKVRCNNIKYCKYYDFSRKVERFEAVRKVLDRSFQDASRTAIDAVNFTAMYQELCKGLGELELPDE